MAKFSEVFSTTLKVILALILIGACGSVVYWIIGAASSGHGSGSIAGSHDSSTGTDAMNEYDRRADDRHTKMPKSQWDKIVAQAIKQHCPFEGMTKDEVEKALGKPENTDVFSTGDFWKYELADEKKCSRYDGDKCVEHPVETKTLMFTPNGHLKQENCYQEPFFSRYYQQLP